MPVARWSWSGHPSLVRHAAAKDLRRRASDPVALLLWVAVPLVIGAVILAATGGHSGPRIKADVLVVDEDRSALTQLVLRLFDSERESEIVRLIEVDMDEGQARMERGEAAAMVIVPPQFTRAILFGVPMKLVMVPNPAQRILPRIVEEGLRGIADVVFYMHRVLGDDLKKLLPLLDPDQKLPTPEEGVQVARDVQAAVARTLLFLGPPKIDLESRIEGPEEQSEIPLGVLFLPGIVTMGLLFMAQGLGEDIWKEHQLGTLRRAASTPGGLQGLLRGKALASLILLFGNCAIVLGAGMVYFSLSLWNYPLAVLWGTVAGFLLTALMMWIVIQASTARAGSILTSILLFPLLMIGGSFFPSEMMPRWMVLLGQWTPNGWAVEVLKDILLGRSAPGQVTGALAVFLPVGLVLYQIAAWQVERRFGRGEA